MVSPRFNLKFSSVRLYPFKARQIFRGTVTFTVSPGHDGSLIFTQPSRVERIMLYPEKFRRRFLRFSVGLENAEDILSDLRQAMEATGLL